MEKRIALITGATRGIGLETARQLARENIHVLLGARNKAKGDTAAEGLRAEGHSAEAVLLEVSDPAHHQSVRAFIEQKFGRLDILVNNAGIAPDSDLPPSEAPIGEVRDTFETNFFAPIALTQALLPLLRKSKAGRIVNLSSRLGSLTANAAAYSASGFNAVAYNASKAALNMFTVLLAHEVKADGIKVNSAHPGWVRTEMGGPDAPLDVSEGAKTSVWLATLPADGPTGGFFHKRDALPW